VSRPNLSEFWPAPSAHRIYWESRHNSDIYAYDPADDGPEVKLIQDELFLLLLDSVFK
jgi:hypothetical protein